MSKSNTTTMHISANFDVAQVSPTLECVFKRSDDTGKRVVGKNAGSVPFNKGEEVFVQINAGGEQLFGGPRPFASFSVIDCTVTSRPRVYKCGPNEKKVIYAPPSPFLSLDENAISGATSVLPAADFEKVNVESTLAGYYQEGMRWKGNLVVGKVAARWRLTLMVTVQINYVDNAEPEYRVLEIDPEVEVGNGVGGPLEEERDVLAMATCEVDPEVEVGNGVGGRT
jgi:hypothetical protein